MSFYNNRFDFLKSQSESLPTGENVVTGSTCYDIDTGKLYIYYKGEWKEQQSGSSGESGSSQIEYLGIVASTGNESYMTFTDTEQDTHGLNYTSTELGSEGYMGNGFILYFPEGLSFDSTNFEDRKIVFDLTTLPYANSKIESWFSIPEFDTEHFDPDNPENNLLNDYIAYLGIFDNSLVFYFIEGIDIENVQLNIKINNQVFKCIIQLVENSEPIG